MKNATIVGVHQKGVMFGQEVSGTVYYVLGFNNGWTTQTANPYIANVDKLAELKGTSALRYGLYQFSDFDVTVGAASTLQLPAPVNFDAAAIDAYVADPVYKYVKVVGVLDIDTSNPDYKTYTITIAGVTGKTVAFAYGLDSYYAGLVSGDVVEATGFALGYDTSNSKLNIMLRDIQKNTTVPAVTITTEPETFAATDPQPQTLAYTFANTTAAEISFAIEGTNADKFTIVSTTDANVVVKANGNNESDAAYTANLVAKVAGATLASVELKQAKATSGNVTVINVDFAGTTPDGAPTTAYENETKTFAFSGYDFKFVSDGSNGYKFNRSSGNNYLIFGKKGAYIQLPAVAGKALTKVVCVSRKGASGSVMVGIATTDGAFVTGGTPIKWAQTDPYTFTYELTGTAVNTPYCVRIDSAHNAQIVTMELTYE